jgi:hypothetical protein
MAKVIIARFAPIPVTAGTPKVVKVAPSQPKNNFVVTKAMDLMSPLHPLNATFIGWCKNKGQEPTKRQARKFCQQYDVQRAA